MAEKSKVTRITATDDTPKEKKSDAKAAKKTNVTKDVKKTRVSKNTPKSKAARKAVKKANKQEKPLSKHWYIRFFQGIGRYFVGSWTELKEVRWPTRKATWGLTIAVLIFSGFFVGVIVLLDMGFNALFELIIVK